MSLKMQYTLTCCFHVWGIFEITLQQQFAHAFRETIPRLKCSNSGDALCDLVPFLQF